MGSWLWSRFNLGVTTFFSGATSFIPRGFTFFLVPGSSSTKSKNEGVVELTLERLGAGMRS